MMQGKFISIEGTEGAGKSTALQFIKQYLTKNNIDVVWTREPGGTELAEEIRRLVLHPMSFEEIEPETELLLMFAARAQHMKKYILPALNSGKWVATDRFIDASYAYQGGGRGIAMDYITMLDKWIVGSTYPQLTLLLDIAPHQGFERAEKRGTDKDRIEQEKMDFFVRVRDVYLERAKQDPERIKVIDASVPLFAVENQIRDVLDEFIKRR
ncbi:Thymidylate kinase [Aquicella siphonis]|uniref:Thymidylate kinase n=1 Tax=Aquicella siphonis TaxID=254247 RepID=A0A5E4PGC6_9COXI|nr:dTMP kinase [Aquicella siphonis]VVC75914.1 Thymidylate kinase [Aquicella siphonis]